MVDLEDRRTAQCRQAVGAAVEARAEDHELLCLPSQTGDRIVDVARAGHARGAGAGYAAVDDRAHEASGSWERAEPGDEAERVAEEAPGKRIPEEAPRLGPRRLERPEERHVLRGSAR